MFDVLEKTFIVGKAFESVDFYFFNILVAYRIEMWIERLLGMQMRGLSYGNMGWNSAHCICNLLATVGIKIHKLYFKNIRILLTRLHVLVAYPNSYFMGIGSLFIALTHSNCIWYRTIN